MEPGLSIGNTVPSKIFRGVTKRSKTATATTNSPSDVGSCSFRFCMAIADEYRSTQVEDQNSPDDQHTLKEKPRTKAINLPVQLDLLPDTPCQHHLPLPRSCDNGNSNGGSSINVPAGRGFSINSVPASMAGTEDQATSSLRLDFGSYNRTGSVELGNDTLDMERTSSRASDEDENGIYKKKLRLSKEQYAYLEESYKDHSTPNTKQKLGFATQLNLCPRQVEVWFQNRRARTKLKRTEVDCGYLKKCCETLTVENRRLHKELQELMVLKTASNNPVFPATTLTMCPSCECVATTPTADTKLREASTSLISSIYLQNRPTSFDRVLDTPPSDS